MLSYVRQHDMAQLDNALVTDYKYTTDQLIELTGLSCATAIAKTYPAKQTEKTILVWCGPGNKGGNGLVLARHLKLFNYKNVEIRMIETTDNFQHFKHQCNAFGIPFVETLPMTPEDKNFYALYVDAIFDYVFKKPIRPDYVPVMDLLKSTKVPIASVDVPSGWDVDKGPGPSDFVPDLLISLTAPKMCAKNYKGNHFLGGRYVPFTMAQKYKLVLPSYPTTDCVVKLS